MPNFLSISLTINKNMYSVQIMLPVVFAVFLLRFKAITVDRECLPWHCRDNRVRNEHY